MNVCKGVQGFSNPPAKALHFEQSIANTPHTLQFTPPAFSTVIAHMSQPGESHQSSIIKVLLSNLITPQPRDREINNRPVNLRLPSPSIAYRMTTKKANPQGKVTSPLPIII
jgi:hypothetical protein